MRNYERKRAEKNKAKNSIEEAKIRTIPFNPFAVVIRPGLTVYTNNPDKREKLLIKYAGK